MDARQAENWISEPRFEVFLVGSRLQPHGIKQVIVAIERLQKGKQISRSRVVAGLSFGFWTGLFGRHYEELWRQSLRKAFPSGNVKRTDLSSRLLPIQRFRNRVAHHDCLLDQDVSGRAYDMFQIAEWIDPDARIWLDGTTNVLATLNSRPR